MIHSRLAEMGWGSLVSIHLELPLISILDNKNVETCNPLEEDGTIVHRAHN